MIRTLADVDLIASAGRSPWHAASALSKLVLAAATIALAIAAPALRLLIALHLAAWVLVLTSRMPWRLIAIAGGYPLVFGAMFAAAAWTGPTEAARLVLRPLTASLVAVWLVGTTPYPDLFAPISRLLPRAVADGLFITYRALFDLIARTDRMTRTLKLRGGASVPLRQRLSLAGEGLATLVVYGFERSQRLYATMLLRGHSGRICGCRHYAEPTRADWLVAAMGLVVAAAAVMLWRAG